MAGEFEQNRTVFLKFRQYRKEGLQEKEPEQNKGRQWISLLTDQDSFVEKNAGVKTTDPLHFPDYKKKLKKMKELTNEEDAVITGYAKVEKTPVVLCVLNGDFMMGSMGTVVGEKLTLAIEAAGRKKLPLVIVSASGGARMQEGLFSLMQMAKTAQAIEYFKENGGLYISILTHPTTGGVSASFAFLGDIILAEKNALIGFAGPRVIEQTIKQKLPDGFQSSEFQCEHGFVDAVLDKSEMKKFLGKILFLHKSRR